MVLLRHCSDAVAESDVLTSVGDTVRRREVRAGLDRIIDAGARGYGRTGWLVNGSAVTTGALRWAPVAARDAGFDVVALLAPEHGVHGAVAEGVPVADHRDPWTGLPVCSLYASGPSQLDRVLDGCDTVVVDLPDNGARYSTYLATTADVLEAVAARPQPPRVVVADRPNLLGRSRGGPPLEPGFESFVGRLHVPVRHGMTLGELARHYVAEAALDLDVDVVGVDGWDESGPLDCVPYLPPSPNLNCFAAQLLYLGTCLFEGTNVSEGRGTANPFQQFGAPWLDAAALIDRLAEDEWPGVAFRAVSFVPSASKYRGELCHGVFVHLIDPVHSRPIELGVRLLELVFAQSERAALRTGAEGPGPDRFLDRLWGSDKLSRHLESRTSGAFEFSDAGPARTTDSRGSPVPQR